MVGWHHRLDGQEFEHAPGDGEGHLVCCSPWVAKSRAQLSDFLKQQQKMARKEGALRGREAKCVQGG